MSDQPQLTGVDTLFAPSCRRYKTLTLPVSGHVVRIQSLTEREVSAYQAASLSKDGTKIQKARIEDANRRFITLCLVDTAGNRILNEGHIARMADWDSADTQFLYQECASHAGLKTEDLDSLAKNSENAPVAG